MNTEKRGRGRPPGTGRNDAHVLGAVADMVFAAPALRPTTAMRRAAPNAGDADIRRFQAKWKEERDKLLEQARGRAEARRAANAPSSRRHRSGSRPAALGRISREMESASRRAQEMMDSPALRAARDLQNSPPLRAMRDLGNSPVLKAMRDLENSPALKAVRDLENSPALKAVRDLEKSATMRALRDFDSPTMRAFRQHQEMMERMARGY